MQSVLATVNINIGLGKNNPILTIRSHDNISEIVDKLINDYQLPKKVHDIIMERVKQELPEPPAPKIKLKQTITKIPLTQKRKSVSPLKKSNPSTAKLIVKKTTNSQKENIPNIVNQSNTTSKSYLRKSVSPIKRANPAATFKKLELKPSKSPRKNQTSVLKKPTKSVKFSQPLKIQKLFRHLTKENPANLKILTPEYINIKGLNKNLLNDLQDFFELLEQHEFYKMSEPYFLQKADELGFKTKFSKKEYDSCYLN